MEPAPRHAAPMRAFVPVCLAAVVASASAPGCSSSASDTPLVVVAGCQPLYGGGECTAPYPSDFFRVADATRATGFRVDLQGAGELKNSKDMSADMTETFVSDGFSTVPSIVGALPGALSADGVYGVMDDPERSKSKDGHTLLLRADTGELIAHYTDMGALSEDKGLSPVTVRPVPTLEPKTRYIVAFRDFHDTGGVLTRTPEGFRRLRDKVGSDAALATLRARYESDVFAPLAKAGVDRASLQLAWDFTTGSDEDVTRDMLRVRELTLAWLASHEPAPVVESVRDVDAPGWKVVKGSFKAPHFMVSTELGARLFRDAKGEVAQNGEVDADFQVSIPRSVAAAFAPGRPVAYGHGFFGKSDEVGYGDTLRVADGIGAVMIGTTWIGMSTDDGIRVAGDILGKTADAPRFGDRVHQAMANWLVLTRAVRGPLGKLDAFRRSGDAVHEKDGKSNAGEGLFDPEQLGYLGISQGHILGATMVALNPDLQRAVLNVGGQGFTIMMPRARPFDAFYNLLDRAFQDPLALQLAIALLARPLDRIDPNSYAPFLLEKPLPGDPGGRRVLLQEGLGDSQVPNVGSFAHVRRLKLGYTGPKIEGIYGIAPESAGPSAATYWDFGIDLRPYAKGTLPENPVHGSVRTQPEALTQMDTFFKEGRVVHPCSGACKGK